ncbi:hypothetical protein [Pseudomonas sp. Marseille-QA0892]
MNPARLPFYLILASAVLLGACTRQVTEPTVTPSLDLPAQFDVERTRRGVTDHLTVVVEPREEGSSQWQMKDADGSVLALLILQNLQWHASKVSSPSPQAREFFAALLFALTDESQLSDAYADDDWRVAEDRRTLYIDGAPHWQVIYGSDERMELRIAQDARYIITSRSPYLQ